MYKLFLICMAAMVFSCHGRVPGSKPPVVTFPLEYVLPTTDQQERRKRSEAVCRLHNVPIYTNPTAFFSSPEDDVMLRTKDNVVDRALALYYIGLKSGKPEQSYLNQVDH